MDKIKKIQKYLDFIVEAEQNELAYETNCPIPCSFREYRTVGDPLTGKNFVFESNDERFQTATFVGFEEQKELTYFMLACPHLRRN